MEAADLECASSSARFADAQAAAAAREPLQLCRRAPAPPDNRQPPSQPASQPAKQAAASVLASRDATLTLLARSQPLATPPPPPPLAPNAAVFGASTALPSSPPRPSSSSQRRHHHPASQLANRKAARRAAASRLKSRPGAVERVRASRSKQAISPGLVMALRDGA